MYEDDTQPIEQHSDTQQPPEQPESPQEEQQQEQPLETKPKPEGSAERNFKALREKAERIERERDEALKRLQALETAQQPEEDEFPLDSNDLVEGKHLKQLHKELRKVKQELNKYQQESAGMALEARVRAQFQDFDKVVTKDNVEVLKNTYPEIASTLNASTADLYNTAATAYTLIKKLGIYQEDNYVQDRAIAQRNANKPRPLSSVSPQQGESPLSRANAFANGLTDELKAQLYKEMVEAQRNA